MDTTLYKIKENQAIATSRIVKSFQTTSMISCQLHCNKNMGCLTASYHHNQCYFISAKTDDDNEETTTMDLLIKVISFLIFFRKKKE